MRTRHTRTRRTAVAVTASLLLSAAVVSAPGASADDVAPAKKWLRPDVCAEMALPSTDGLLDDLNHPSIRLDSLPDGTTVTVDERGQIALTGVVHKKAGMVDVAVGTVSTTDFVLGPPPEGVANWAESWTAHLRPPQLGTNLVCTRADREPGRYARVLRSVVVKDLIPPSTVTAVTVDDVTSSAATVSWPAATDNYGLAGYDVRLDGGAARRVGVGTLTSTFTDLAPQSSHTVSVTAVDLAGNTSAAAATATFTTLAPPPPPIVDPALTLDVGPGAVVASWTPDDRDATYRVLLDDETVAEFSHDQFCVDDAGRPAEPCTSGDTVTYPIDDLESGDAYDLTIEVLDAAGTTARDFSARFTTDVVEPEVTAAEAEAAVSESMQCAGQGGDLYVNASLRGQVSLPAGADALFTGCYTVPDATCVDSFDDDDDATELSCSDDMTAYLETVAPTGGGPTLTSLAVGAPSAVRIGAMSVEGASIITLAPPGEAQAVLKATEQIIESAAAKLVLRGIVIVAGKFVIGVVGSVLLDIAFAESLGVAGLVEYPIHHDTDFGSFDNWGLQHGAYLNDLGIYAQTITTTKEITARDDLPFAWSDTEDSRLKMLITHACTTQGGTGPGVCDDDTVFYVPGGTSVYGAPMPETGHHIVEAMEGSNGGWSPDPARMPWLYPAYSAGGKKAKAAGYSHGWFDTARFQPNTCTGRLSGKLPGVARTDACDEFPFWSTNQAVDLSGTLASIQPVPTEEVPAQGNDLQAFLRECGIKDGDNYVVLPVKSWVEVGGPSFGMRVDGGSTDVCMKPRM